MRDDAAYWASFVYPDREIVDMQVYKDVMLNFERALTKYWGFTPSKTMLRNQASEAITAYTGDILRAIRKANPPRTKEDFYTVDNPNVPKDLE